MLFRSTLKKLVQKHKKTAGNSLLEFACGTGAHLEFLDKDFDVTATDISKNMLAVAQKKFPDVAFQQADMVSTNLGKTFDIVLCLFSSIGYVRTYSNLKKTLKNFARHLEPGGVVIIDPWFTKDTYFPGKAHMSIYDGPEIKIARQCISQKKRNLSVMDMHYMVAEAGKDVTHFVDRHELAMFEPEIFLKYMKEAGFAAKFLKNAGMRDRGTYVGVKK